jgi:hypothetical protein
MDGQVWGLRDCTFAVPPGSVVGLPLLAVGHSEGTLHAGPRGTVEVTRLV